MDGGFGEPLSGLAHAKELSDRVDLLVQLLALVRHLALAVARRRGLEPEVDLVVQVITHLREPGGPGFEGGELSAEIVEAEIVHRPSIGRAFGDLTAFRGPKYSAASAA
jgi:hypothetical protein